MEEPLSIIAADDPVTFTVYAKKHSQLNLPGWRRFKNKQNLERFGGTN